MNRNINLRKVACSTILTAAITILAASPVFAMNNAGQAISVMPVSTTDTVPEGQTLGHDPIVTLDRVNLRKGPSTSFEVIKTVNRGTEVQLITITTYNDELDTWYEVNAGNDRGYIKAEFVGKKSEMPFANVTLTPWSEAKNIFTIGVPAEVYDCYTGLTYYVKSFSNGNHADVEPITKEDTDILYQTYGRQWKWDPRPVYVTINGHTMAASINGMPHGGGVNSTNGMNGQICIHFLGSRTHNGNGSFTKWHQDVLMEAYSMSK